MRLHLHYSTRPPLMVLVLLLAARGPLVRNFNGILFFKSPQMFYRRVAQGLSGKWCKCGRKGGREDASSSFPSSPTQLKRVVGGTRGIPERESSRIFSPFSLKRWTICTT